MSKDFPAVTVDEDSNIVPCNDPNAFIAECYPALEGWSGEDVATYLTACSNFCRANNIDPSAADPLAGYREQVKESCAEVLEGRVYWLCEADLDALKAAIMADPAPKETK